jgi:hypothetical protein
VRGVEIVGDLGTWAIVFAVVLVLLAVLERVNEDKNEQRAEMKAIEDLLEHGRYLEAIDRARKISDRKLIEEARKGLIGKAVKMTDRLLAREGTSTETFTSIASYVVSLLADAEAESSYYAPIAMRARDLGAGEIIYQIYQHIPEGSWRRIVHDYLAELGSKLIPTQH